MKTSLFAVTVLAAGLLTAGAQNQNPNEITTHLPTQLPDAHLEFSAPPANEISIGDHVYTGVFVQMAKNASEPWQLVNPFAPREYGTGDCNLHRDIITGEPQGFQFFSIKF